MKLYYILIFILLTKGLLATTQVPDIVFYKQRIFNLYDYINFQDYPKTPTNKPYFVESSNNSTACIKGYYRVWIIENDSLFLADIFKCQTDDIEITVNKELINRLKKYLPVKLLDRLNQFEGQKLSIEEFNKPLTWDEKVTYSWLVAKIGGNDDNSADLNKLFPEKYKNSKVFANWYSGQFNIQDGLDFVFDRRAISYSFKFKNGALKSNFITLDDVEFYYPVEFTRLQTSCFDISIPSELISYNYDTLLPEIKSISFSCGNDSIFVTDYDSGRIIDSLKSTNHYKKAEHIKMKISKTNFLIAHSYQDSIYSAMVFAKKIRTKTFYIYYRTKSNKELAEQKLDMILKSVMLRRWGLPH